MQISLPNAHSRTLIDNEAGKLTAYKSQSVLPDKVSINIGGSFLVDKDKEGELLAELEATLEKFTPNKPQKATELISHLAETMGQNATQQEKRIKALEDQVAQLLESSTTMYKVKKSLSDIKTKCLQWVR